MSKFIFVKYRERQDSSQILRRLKEICGFISPAGLDMNHLAYENSMCPNSFIAIQNSINDQIEASHLLIGHLNSDIEDYIDINKPFPDGSYSLIRFNENYVEFGCDRFCSRTLWYYQDEEKLIISNSQRAIVTLKGAFNLNNKTLSWFLSSGSQGPYLSWDKQIKMVLPCKSLKLSVSDWQLTLTDIEYNFAEIKEKNFDDYFEQSLKKSLKKSVEDFQPDEMVLPLSGGYDSRLLLALMQSDRKLSKVDVINWGVASNGLFDDKKASKKIAYYYGIKYIDRYLPSSISNFSEFLQRYIAAGDCRIDHFNAYTDHFDLWEQLYKIGVKLIIRGEHPYPDMIALNEKMARTHTGINLFKDYSNVTDYDLDEWIELQNDFDSIRRLKDESLIQWRDRLFADLRNPIVISAFSDIINGYVENRAPMLSGESFMHYINLKDSHKGNKSHIVRLSKKMDNSHIGFDAEPAIPSHDDVFFNPEGLNFLKNYLQNCIGKSCMKEGLIVSVIDNLPHYPEADRRNRNIQIFIVRFLSARLDGFIKAFLKSKRKLTLSPVTLAYRIVMADMAVKMYSKDARNI